ncbi:MAG: hypothetical protein ACLT4Y_10325 [Bifidobacterium breve]
MAEHRLEPSPRSGVEAEHSCEVLNRITDATPTAIRRHWRSIRTSPSSLPTRRVRRRVIKAAIDAFRRPSSSSLAYYDGLRSKRLPTALTWHSVILRAHTIAGYARRLPQAGLSRTAWKSSRPDVKGKKKLTLNRTPIIGLKKFG